ncbi:hypothetical protein BDV11DRAFT_200906 [Aspergillus similis]
MFLNRLPKEYGTIRDSLFSNIMLEKGLILLRLQQKKSQLRIVMKYACRLNGERAERNCINYTNVAY